MRRESMTLVVGAGKGALMAPTFEVTKTTVSCFTHQAGNRSLFPAGLRLRREY